MANHDEIEVVSDDPQGQSVEQESEKVRRLKRQLSDVYQAWVSGQPPPQGPSEGTYTVPQDTQPPLPITSDHILPPGYVPNYNFPTAPGTSNVRPPAAPVRNTPLVMSGAPVYTIPPPNPMTRPNIEPLYHAYDGQCYSPDMAFKVSTPHNQTLQYESPTENEKALKTGEPDEMVRKMKSLEQNIKNIQGLGFKTLKFKKYDGHGDPIAHSKKYCNQLRGARGKEDLLMAYFGESLVGVASEWFIDQDVSHWHIWDGMAQAFIKQFHYNIDIASDRNSLSNMKKRPTESFKEYAVRWREQASRVKPPMYNNELITVFLQAQDLDYFQNIMSVMDRPFADAIKIGEMIENGLNTGRIISQVALKVATQEIQNRPDNLVNQKKKDEESMMASRAKRGQRGTSQPPDPRYSVAPQYAIFNAQSYAKPSNRQHMQAPALTYFRPRPKQECEREHK
ncbi:uncharacterized protein [Nicotiana tomentosiformis]|uniref:uncharacterized protein n=1 Tax=Nicotiana tomentosiformis TaxID=4098 RepID=UPI00388CD07F